MKCLMKAVLGLAIACVSPVASAQLNEPLPIGLGTPQVFSEAVVPGQTEVVFDLPLVAVDRFNAEIIVPVASASLTVLDPSETPVAVNAQFYPGSTFSPTLPGGVFLLDEVVKPVSGVWKLKVNFPPAVEKTAVQVLASLTSPYRSGIALTQSVYVLGQEVPVGVVMLNEDGSPILGGTGRVEVTSPSGVKYTLLPRDNGQLANGDGKVDDGVYSDQVFFSELGPWKFVSDMKVPTPQGEVTRTSVAFTRVVDPAILLNKLTTTLVWNASEACYSGINIKFDAQVLKKGSFMARGVLRAGNGNVLARVTPEAAKNPGATAFNLLFSSEELLEKMEEYDGPYAVSIADLMNNTPLGITIDARKVNAQTSPVFKADDLCAPPVQIGKFSTMTPQLDDGYIGAMLVSFPVKVKQAGSYAISFKVTDALREDIKMHGENYTLSKGLNMVTALVPAEYFRAHDGPYQVESVLVTGTAGSAIASILRDPTPYSRWQFHPGPVIADLTNDGVVNNDDRQLLISFRNQPALVPGDRRDLNRDGIIDLRDVQVLQGLGK